MSTLIQPFIRATSYATSASIVLWFVTLCCDRLSAMHTTYYAHIAKLRDEEWLRARCRDPEFFLNMRSHTNICEEVDHNSRQNILLLSLSEVMRGTYLCGGDPCMSYVRPVVDWFLSLSIPVMLCVSFMALMFPAVLVQLVLLIYDTMHPRYHRSGLMPLRPWSAEDGDAYNAAYGTAYGLRHDMTFGALRYKPLPDAILSVDTTGIRTTPLMIEGALERNHTSRRGALNARP